MSTFKENFWHRVSTDRKNAAIWIASEVLNEADAEIYNLRSLAAACYAGLGAECELPEPWLDALFAAASGEPFTTDGLLPFTKEQK